MVLAVCGGDASGCWDDCGRERLGRAFMRRDLAFWNWREMSMLGRGEERSRTHMVTCRYVMPVCLAK